MEYNITGMLDYTGDPRAILMHEGNKNSGRYPRGSGERPFQHTGIMRRKARGNGLNPLNAVVPTKYQNPDGSLTAEGEIRYASELRKNLQKKKDNRADPDSLRDPNLWERQDLERRKDVVEATRKFTSDLSNLAEPKAKRRGQYDLTETTDDELRQKIQRLQMEDQYTRLMDAKDSTISKGRAFFMDTLDTAGKVLATTSSALAIALAIKTLKG